MESEPSSESPVSQHLEAPQPEGVSERPESNEEMLTRLVVREIEVASGVDITSPGDAEKNAIKDARELYFLIQIERGLPLSEACDHIGASASMGSRASKSVLFTHECDQEFVARAEAIRERLRSQGVSLPRPLGEPDYEQAARWNHALLERHQTTGRSVWRQHKGPLKEETIPVRILLVQVLRNEMALRQSEIAKVLGTSDSAVCRLLLRADEAKFDWKQEVAELRETVESERFSEGGRVASLVDELANALGFSPEDVRLPLLAASSAERILIAKTAYVLKESGFSSQAVAESMARSDAEVDQLHELVDKRIEARDPHLTDIVAYRRIVGLDLRAKRNTPEKVEHD